MSYDYMLVSRFDLSGRESDLAAFAESAESQNIGALDTIKRTISQLFPSVQWRQVHTQSNALALSSWFGLQGPPEFHLMADADQNVKIFNMSYCQRAEVVMVLQALGLVALDLQSSELFDA